VSTASVSSPFVTELFRAQVSRTPTASALIHRNTRLDYAELDDRSNALAHVLAKHGAGRGILIALYLGQSVDLVVAILAVLKTGAGYLPLSTTDPSRRLGFILRDAEAALIIAAEEDISVPVAPTRVLRLKNLNQEMSTGWRAAPLTCHDIAYVVYTSGSTGQSKGVIIEHGALATYLAHVRLTYPSISGRTLLHSPISYDMAVTSLFGPLITGGALDVAALEEMAEPRQAIGWFSQPSFLKITPSHLRLLGALPVDCSPSEQLVIGGEALTSPALDAWRRKHPSVAVINEYGPTEATVGCCIHSVPPGEVLEPGPVPIGQPTPGARLLVLDAGLHEAGAGSTGELYIAGDQLARGYLGRPAQTATAFVANPFGPPGSRMYRSGDVVRQRPDGLLEFVGRADGQVKIGGVRVEPAEVAAVIMRSGQVSSVAVAARSVARGQCRLVAYVTVAAGTDLDTGTLQDYVAALLPGPMRPAAFVVMDVLPLTANGKVDHSALPAPPELPATPADLPRTAPEAVLCRLFSELTGTGFVGLDDDFFVLGGTSLAAARLVIRARREGIFFSLQDVLGMRTARELTRRRADALHEREGERA
jgi:amino acid adenylation domain-containing protein